MKKLLLLTAALASSLAAAAQQTQLKGKVLDEQGQPVPYANVGVPGAEPGTATNEAGEFSLRVTKLPQKLAVVSLGYAPTVLSVTSGAPVTITLKASTVALPEVKVRNPDQLAAELVKRAYAKLARHQKEEEFGQAFYRQKQRHNGRYTEFLDAFYDVRFDGQGINGWQLQQARYGSAAEDTGVDMSNFSAALRLIPVFDPKPSRRTVSVPLSPGSTEFFTFQLREVLENKGQETAVIEFSKRPGVDRFVPEGTLYIDFNTAALRRVDAQIPIEHLMAMQLRQGTTLDGQTMQLTVDFAPHRDSLSRLQSIRAEQQVVLRYRGQTDTTTINGNLFFYRYTAQPAGKGYKTTGVGYNDLKQASKKAYDPAFWRNQEVLRASPAEERVIRDLEKRKAFGAF
ncbi:carboxypeptidase-like regulatory domain-containing protein [Hymenobacter endophyticus]|uniref:Carboxypeptidase-like regulatory domain-containing protein n=1 Tax=Hymenobacter endophyticus TaxID=3076335 RepID=A0ABU3TIZ5_9BACT|nr:carboxypeptidase-like regulatory domain-containing protein [Hymenobacter endophyticus]MDU0371342.1 carboxypeptidase-like regulatory domain-containing protein [Hymenobacter endophyticus]